MPQVKFSVSGSDLTSYFDKVKKQGNALTDNFIENAKKEAASAKEQLRIIHEQTAALEKRNRLQDSIKKTIARENIEARISNIPNRDMLFENLHRANQNRFDKGLIGEGQYKGTQSRIDEWIHSNTPKNLKSDYKDFLRRQNEQIREQQLTTKYARENIEAVKEGAKENVTAVKSGDSTLVEIIEKAQTPTEKLAAELARERLENEKKSESPESKKGNFLEGLTGSLLTVDSARRAIGDLSQFTQTQNGFDLIKPTGDLIGRVAGGVIGAVIGSFIEPGGGTMAGTAVGSELFGAIGGGAAEFTARRAMSMQDYQAARNRFIATTGANRGFDVAAMDNVGLSSKDYISLMRETARTASSNNAEKYTQDAYYANKGYGVDQSTSMGVIDLQRSGRENNKDLANLIGAVLEKGKNTFFKNGDSTFLNEFLTKFTSLQKDLLKTQNTVASGTTFDILQKFNSLGGQFSGKDPRSLGIIEGINNALINPASDNMKAASFLALKQANPGMDFFDIYKEQKKGLGSPTYMKSMLEMVDRMGGDPNQKKMNIMNMFGLQNNPEAAESIFNNEGKLKTITSTQDLERLIPTNLKGKAEENTTVIEKNMASISDGLLKGWYETLDVMKDSFARAMDEVVSGARVTDKNGRIVYSSNIKENGSKSPTDAQWKVKQQANSFLSWYNQHIPNVGF